MNSELYLRVNPCRDAGSFILTGLITERLGSGCYGRHLKMAGYFLLTIILLTTLAIAPPTNGQLLSNEDNPSVIDRVLQVIWEPSSLIRMWVGLDQLFNIARSWKTVAKKLATLPFGEDSSESHVRIQEPRSFKYSKPSVASQWDRFNKIYSSSNLSPIVAHARTQQAYGEQLSNALSSELQPVVRTAKDAFRSEHNYVPFGLPPLFLFQPQEVFLDQYSMDLFKNVIRHSSPFANRDDQEAISKVMQLQKQENQRILRNSKYMNVFGDSRPSALFPNTGTQVPALNSSPQERLNMLLKLLKSLGDMHRNHAGSTRTNSLASVHPKNIAEILAASDG